VLFYVSPESIQSRVVLSELSTALGADKPVIPIVLPSMSTSIKRYLQEYSYQIPAQGVEVAYEIANKIDADSIFVPRSADADFYDRLITRIAALAPKSFNLLGGEN
jgi:hypothetical protein